MNDQKRVPTPSSTTRFVVFSIQLTVKDRTVSHLIQLWSALDPNKSVSLSLSLAKLYRRHTIRQ